MGDTATDFQALDSGQSNIDWNALLGKGLDAAGAAIKTAGDIQKAKANRTIIDTTPVPATSPIQVPTTVAGFPTILVVGGIALVLGAMFLLRK